jgi:hypothetical protein
MIQAKRAEIIRRHSAAHAKATSFTRHGVCQNRKPSAASQHRSRRTRSPTADLVKASGENENATLWRRTHPPGILDGIVDWVN